MPTGKHGSETQGVIFLPSLHRTRKKDQSLKMVCKAKTLGSDLMSYGSHGKIRGPPKSWPQQSVLIKSLWTTEPPRTTWLVVWNIFCFSIYWDNHPQLFHIFQRGRYTTNQLLLNPYQPSIIGAAVVTLRWLGWISFFVLSSESIGFNQQLSSVQSLCCLIIGDDHNSLYSGIRNPVLNQPVFHGITFRDFEHCSTDDVHWSFFLWGFYL